MDCVDAGGVIGGVIAVEGAVGCRYGGSGDEGWEFGFGHSGCLGAWSHRYGLGGARIAGSGGCAVITWLSRRGCRMFM